MRHRLTTAALILLTCLTGCRSKPLKSDHGVRPHPRVLQRIEYPDVQMAAHAPLAKDLLTTPPPPSVRNPEETPKWELTLDECIRIALSNGQVIRRLGGRVVTSPNGVQGVGVQTVFNPATGEVNPGFGTRGVEAALAEFDATYFANMYLERTDRRFNNIFFASAGAQRQQNLFQSGVTKTAATGTEFALENITTFDRIVGQGLSLEDLQERGNRYESFYETIFQGRVRHPLLQGGGVEFNRIAGPNARPGQVNGVVIARINSSIGVDQFQRAVRDFLRDVEQTYWELYFAYQDLHTKQTGRDTLLRIWQLEQRRLEVGTGRVDEEAAARESYFTAQALVENSLTTGGFVAFGTGGTTRSQGVFEVENQLRNLMGVPATDGRLILPVTEPVKADVRFEWSESLERALSSRVELRMQQWHIKRREMELIAARNFRLPQLDLVGEYRFRGFGDQLFGTGNAPPLGDEEVGPPISAFQDLFTGNYQEYRVGLELTMPVGNRLAHAAVRYAELDLIRQRALYDQMQLDIATELRTAFTELDRAYQVSRSNYNRAQASLVRTQAESRRERVGEGRLDPVLQAIRQYVDADIQYHRAIVDYNLALLNLHYTRGTLFDYHSVYLAEGPWVPEAYESAKKQSRRFRPTWIPKRVEPGPVSRGAVPQMEPVPPATPLDGAGQPPRLEELPTPPAQSPADLPSAGGNGPGTLGGSNGGNRASGRNALEGSQPPTSPSLPGGRAEPLNLDPPPGATPPAESSRRSEGILPVSVTRPAYGSAPPPSAGGGPWSASAPSGRAGSSTGMAPADRFGPPPPPPGYAPPPPPSR